MLDPLIVVEELNVPRFFIELSAALKSSPLREIRKYPIPGAERARNVHIVIVCRGEQRWGFLITPNGAGADD